MTKRAAVRVGAPKVPAGYRIVRSGVVEDGDKILYVYPYPTSFQWEEQDDAGGCHVWNFYRVARPSRARKRRGRGRGR